MTRRIYLLVVTGMAAIALLAVVRSFAGGNEVAAVRLGWGSLAFTYPGMWDLLGIIGSVLWVRTQLRGWGRFLTLTAVSVVGVSIGSEAYVTARATPEGWPEAAFALSAAVPVLYAVLTHVASRANDALLEETPSAPPTTSVASSASSTTPPAAPSPSETVTELQSAPYEALAPSSSSPGLLLPPALAEQLLAGSPSPSSGETSPASPASFSPSTTEDDPPTVPTPTSASPSTTAAAGGPPTPPAPSSPGSSSATAAEPSPTSPATGDSPAAATSTPSASTPPDPDDRKVTDPTGDREDPATYGSDGQAPPAIRKRWAQDKASVGVYVTGGDIDRRFGTTGGYRYTVPREEARV